MDWIKIILLINVLWISGCAGSKAFQKHKEPMTMMEVYSSGIGQAQKDVGAFVENNLKEQKTFGYVKPYIPVVNDPVVRKVWVPDHKSDGNSDVLVGGHWVYVMIQPPTWFIDGKDIKTQAPIIVPSLVKTEGLREEKKDHGY